MPVGATVNFSRKGDAFSLDGNGKFSGTIISEERDNAMVQGTDDNGVSFTVAIPMAALRASGAVTIPIAQREAQHEVAREDRPTGNG